MDGTDAVMLSAETAAGKHPAKVVEAMAQIIVGAEKYQGAHVRIRQRNTGYFDRTNEAIAAAVMYTANHLHVQGHRRAHGVRRNRAVDVAGALGHSDLRLYAPGDRRAAG